jgi:hypothetical protein
MPGPDYRRFGLVAGCHWRSLCENSLHTQVVRWHRRDGLHAPIQPYGSEAWWTEIEGPPPPDRCHDCDVPLGGYHVAGCDMERCPVDGSQAIQCECAVVEQLDWDAPHGSDDAGPAAAGILNSPPDGPGSRSTTHAEPTGDINNTE